MPTSVQPFDLPFIQSINSGTLGKLLKISLHAQHMYMKCHVFPMGEDARFQLLSLQESTLMSIEAIESHCEKSSLAVDRMDDEVHLLFLLDQYAQLLQQLRINHIVMTAPDDFVAIGNWGCDRKPIPMGVSAAAACHLKRMNVKLA